MSCLSKVRFGMRACPLAIVLLSAALALAGEEPVMVLEGDVSAVHRKGVFAVFDPFRLTESLPIRATTGSPASDDDKVFGFSYMPPVALAQAPIGPDGAFRLEIPVDAPKVAYFAVTGAETSENMPPEFAGNSNRFILEPGELKLRMIHSNYSVITNGRYNDAVYGSWRLSDEYRAAQEEYSRLRTPGEDESDEDRVLRSELLWKVEESLKVLEWEGTQEVRETQDDALIRQLANDSFMAFMPVALAIVRDMVRRSAELPVAEEGDPPASIRMYSGRGEIRLVKKAEDSTP